MPLDPATQAPTPLLTIAIPTWNRSGLLEQLLESLSAQHLDPAEVELLIADNASTDTTPELVGGFTGQLHPRYLRHPENLGSDANFVFCFEQARGRYFWLLSDDDLLVPGAVKTLLRHLRTSDFDLIYATSYPFRHDPVAERISDPLHRTSHTLTHARDVARVVNIMFTFISGIIINRQRLLTLPHEPPRAFLGTNLVQLSWSLPLLLHHRRSLVLWDRPVAGRQGNSGGYSLGHVFGQNLSQNTRRCLPGRPDLARIILNVTLRRWFPSTVYEHRSATTETYALSTAEPILRHTYGRNWRFWIFTWPVLRLPLPLARLWFRAGAGISKVIYALSVPGFYRKEIP